MSDTTVTASMPPLWNSGQSVRSDSSTASMRTQMSKVSLLIWWVPMSYLPHCKAVLRLARQLLGGQHALDTAVEANKHAVVGSSGHVSVRTTARQRILCRMHCWSGRHV